MINNHNVKINKQNKLVKQLNFYLYLYKQNSNKTIGIVTSLMNNKKTYLYIKNKTQMKVITKEEFF